MSYLDILPRDTIYELFQYLNYNSIRNLMKANIYIFTEYKLNKNLRCIMGNMKVRKLKYYCLDFPLANGRVDKIIHIKSLKNQLYKGYIHRRNDITVKSNARITINLKYSVKIALNMQCIAYDRYINECHCDHSSNHLENLEIESIDGVKYRLGKDIILSGLIKITG
jgi:hypothetical protein